MGAHHKKKQKIAGCYAIILPREEPVAHVIGEVPVVRDVMPREIVVAAENLGTLVAFTMTVLVVDMRRHSSNVELQTKKTGNANE